MGAPLIVFGTLLLHVVMPFLLVRPLETVDYERIGEMVRRPRPTHPGRSRVVSVRSVAARGGSAGRGSSRPVGETHTAARELPPDMYRAILPNGQLEAEDYEHVENGVELYDGEDELLAFVPYANLEALLTESAYERDDPDVM